MTLGFFWGNLVSGMAIRPRLRGASAFFRWVLGLRYRGVKDGPLLEVDSIDVLFVGMGLVLFVLVMLRR